MFEGFSIGCLVVGSSLIWKKEKLPEMVTCCHLLSLVVPLVSLVVPLVVTRCTTRCHSLSLVVLPVVIRCHSLSFVVTRCTTRCHSLSLVVSRCTTRLSFYKRSAFMEANKINLFERWMSDFKQNCSNSRPLWRHIF